ncbi:hypothetical protein [Testudinibacter aquarius]|nr:hypothetical protein [Testudinibacter aquarius]
MRNRPLFGLTARLRAVVRQQMRNRPLASGEWCKVRLAFGYHSLT